MESKFNLQELKNQVSVTEDAAKCYIQMHNPGRNLKNEPYASLVRNATNDFLRMEAMGFKIVKSDVPLPSPPTEQQD